MAEEPPTLDEDAPPDAGLWCIIESLSALLECYADWHPPWALRERLPDRRHAETADLWHRDKRYHLTIGEYPNGKPGEVFIHGARSGSDTDLLCADIAVLISRLLQHGDTPDAIAGGLGVLGDGQTPASIVGVIVASLAARTGNEGGN